MKKLLAKVVMAVAALGASALAEAAVVSYNVLCINRVDGAKDMLLLDPALDFSVTEEGNIRLSHPQIAVEYTMAELASFTFEEAENPDLYNGDHQAGIEAPEAPADAVIVEPGRIAAGEETEIAVYDTAGRLVARAQGELSTSGLARGIYIVRAGQTTLKISL